MNSIFESQNASVEEANKTKFLAFRINKCKFTGKDQSAGNRLLTLKTLDSSGGSYGTTDISVHEYHLDVGELTVFGTNIIINNSLEERVVVLLFLLKIQKSTKL